MRWVAAAALVPLVAAYRWYGNALPTLAGHPVPCPPEGAPGCRGTGFCEAIGHAGCYTLGTATTAFGKSVQAAIERAPSRGWNSALCASDDDGDGFTAGDELGDGCCAWPLQPVTPLGAVSNPSFASSKPPYPSCTSADTLPAAPTNLLASAAGVGAVQVTWAQHNASQACTCEHWAAVYNSSAGATSSVPLTSTYVSGTSVVLCGLPAGSSVTVAVAGVHRGGRGTASTVVVTVPASGGPAVGCTAVSSTFVVIDTANSTAAIAAVKALVTRPQDLAPTTGIAWVALCALLVGVPAFIAAWLLRDTHAARRYAVHVYLPACCLRTPASRGGRLQATAPTLLAVGGSGSSCGCSRLCGQLAADLQLAGVGYTVAVVLAAIALAAAVAQTYSWYNWLYFPLGTRYAIARASGYGAALGLGLQLLPVTRFSLWAKLFGVPFERALVLHRWSGWMTVILTVIHGVWMGAGFALDGPFDVNHIFLWTTVDAVNPLAGFVAGLCMVVLALTSWSPIRRRFYELFLAGHLLWPVVFIMAFLHIEHSDTPALPLAALGLVLLGIDVLLMGLDALVLRNAVVVDCGLCFPDGSLLSCSSIVPALPNGGTTGPAAVVDCAQATARMRQAATAAFVVLDKHPAAAFGPSVWPFRYSPGQYVYIAFPGATGSVLPHPVSISSAPDRRPVGAGGAPGRLSVTIKSMGAGTWSGKLMASIHRVLAARIQQLSARSSGPTRALEPGASSRNPLNQDVSASGATADIADGEPSPAAGDGAAEPAPLLNASAHASVSQHAWPVPAAGALLPPSTIDALVAYDGEPGAPVPTGLVVSLPIPAEVHHLVRAWVTGPFGAPSVQLHHAKHFVLIAGGVGITPIASLHQSLATGVPLQPRHTKPVKVRTLTTVWAVRDLGLAAAFAPCLPTQLHRAAAATARAGAVAAEEAGASGAGGSSRNLTGSGRDDDDHAAGSTAGDGSRVSVALYSGSTAASGGAPALDGILIHSGRPDLKALLLAAGNRASAFDMALNKTSTFVAVAVCGPDEMVRSVIAAAQELNSMSSGSAGLSVCCARAKPVSSAPPVYFAVHRETFVM